jgi:hypothetical protein
MKNKRAKNKQEPCETGQEKNQEEPDKDSQTEALKPSKLKIGESPDNLKQRSEWFQKRTGKK